MVDHDEDDVNATSPETQYEIVATCTLGIEHQTEKLRQYTIGEKQMSEKEIAECLAAINSLSSCNRLYALQEFVSLDSDSIQSIEGKVRNELILETDMEAESASNRYKTPSKSFLARLKKR